LFTLGSNGKLTNVDFSNIGIEFEPKRNLVLRGNFSYRKLKSASESFNLNFYADASQTAVKTILNQPEANFQIDITPGRRTIGYGVERVNTTARFARIFMNFSHGFKGAGSSNFDYNKVQIYYKQPIVIGPIGNSELTVEVGKTFGAIPLGLLSVVPGNQSVFAIGNTFNNLNFYEFVTDTYTTFQWNHDFNGKIFARIPYIRKLNWRENIGIKAVYGTVSNENKLLNASTLIYHSPDKPYWEYNVGIGNIFKVFKVDFSWRGNYRDVPDGNNFVIKGSFGFFF
jgi:Family of unknown function (DUF5686)